MDASAAFEDVKHSKQAIRLRETLLVGVLTEAENEHIKVYVLDLISPEMLWDYGGIIPMVEQIDSVYQLPKEVKFGLLICDSKIIEERNLNKQFNISQKETYDINIGEFNSRRHKIRYVNHYYIFERK